MLDKLGDFFKDFSFALQTAKLYSPEHPRFVKVLDQFYDSLSRALDGREDFTVGIVGEEIAFEKEILFELSRMVNSAILYLKEKGIEKLTFLKGVTKEELKEFVLSLLAIKKDSKVSITEYLAIKKISNILVSDILVSGDGEEKIKIKSKLNVYDDFTQKGAQVLQAVSQGQPIHYLNLRFSLTNVLELLMSQPENMLALLCARRYEHLAEVHDFNVTILSMHLALNLGFTKEDVMNIGMAGLFHDIGRLVSDLNQARHTLAGAELLLGYTETLGVLPVVLAFEHHSRFRSLDDSGLNTPYLVSLLLSIADFYDYVSQRMLRGTNYPVDFVFSLMRQGRDTVFHSYFLDVFLKTMGVWPIGTIVNLSDSRIAVVRQQDPQDAYNPKVEIIKGNNLGEMICLKQFQPVLQVVNLFNPNKDDKSLLSFIGDDTLFSG